MSLGEEARGEEVRRRGGEEKRRRGEENKDRGKRGIEEERCLLAMQVLEIPAIGRFPVSTVKD